MKKRYWKLAAFLLVLIGLALLNAAVVWRVDWLWFSELGYPVLFLKGFLAKISLALMSGGAFFVIIMANAWLARRMARQPAPYDIDSLLEFPQLSPLKAILHKVLVVAALFFAYLTGSWGSGQWDTYLCFNHAVPFGTTDPLFGLDIGFYLFRLPFYRFLYQFLFATLVVSFLFSAAVYLIEGGVWLTRRGLRLARQAHFHLAALVAGLLILYAVQYKLAMFDLLYSNRGILYGAGYTDIKAQLPALQVLMGLCVMAALLVVTGAFWRSYKLALWGIVALIAGSVLGNVIIPGLIQRFEVTPNEISKESPYIDLEIKYTWLAYGLNGLQSQEFPALGNLTLDSLKANELTLQNIRLWDHRPLLRTFGQLQVIRPYYDFVDVDNDRYVVDGKYRQVSLSPRELSSEKLPSRIWINEHLTFTHGYGLCLGPVNQITSEGLPQFLIKDIPPTSASNIKVTRPQIYFGELTNSYCFVKTREKEFDYPSGAENVNTEYAGQGGIPVGNFLRKLLFAFRFKEQNILLSTAITAESRLLFDRNIVARVTKLMPFLRYDHDPYMVISEAGELFWIIDGYTVSDKFPYSHPINDEGNYFRNSVKITVDAYHGTVRFYLSDPSDPIIQVYAKIFPNVFQPISAMPEDLRQHIRYPEDLFNIQAQMYATYHMQDPQVFYNKEDLWRIPATGKKEEERSVEPYYTIMKLNEKSPREEFLLMTPFTPANRENMISLMVARCDAPNYGQLIVYDFPKQRLIYGPTQIASRFNQDTEISKQLSLWNQKGSTVMFGSLLVVPVENSILYVQPLYLAADQTGSLPELKRIIVAYGDKIAMEESLEQSLSAIFGGEALPSETRAATTTASTPGNQSVQALITQAREEYDRAQQALRQGNWAGYGDAIKQLGGTLEQLKNSGR